MSCELDELGGAEGIAQWVKRTAWNRAFDTRTSRGFMFENILVIVRAH